MLSTLSRISCKHYLQHIKMEIISFSCETVLLLQISGLSQLLATVKDWENKQCGGLVIGFPMWLNA